MALSSSTSDRRRSRTRAGVGPRRRRIIDPRPGHGRGLLREFGMEEHPQGGFHGLLEVIPTRADSSWT